MKIGTLRLKEVWAAAVDVYIPVNVMIVFDEFEVGMQVTAEE